MPYSEKLTAHILGCEAAPVKVKNNNGKAELVFPAINPDEMKSQWLYTVRLADT